MSFRTSTRCSLMLLMIGALFLCGCEGEFINDAARANFASFLTQAFSTAVNAALAP